MTDKIEMKEVVPLTTIRGERVLAAISFVILDPLTLRWFAYQSLSVVETDRSGVKDNHSPPRR